MPVLYCWDVHKRTGWWAEVGAEAFTLGGSAVAAVPLPDRSLEPQEAIVRRSGDAYVVQDLATSGRLRVNDEPLGETQHRELNVGDCISLGRVRLTFFLEAPTGPINPSERYQSLLAAPSVVELPTGQITALLAAALALGFCGGIVLGILQQALAAA